MVFSLLWSVLPNYCFFLFLSKVIRWKKREPFRYVFFYRIEHCLNRISSRSLDRYKSDQLDPYKSITKCFRIHIKEHTQLRLNRIELMKTTLNDLARGWHKYHLCQSHKKTELYQICPRKRLFETDSLGLSVENDTYQTRIQDYDWRGFFGGKIDPLRCAWINIETIPICKSGCIMRSWSRQRMLCINRRIIP